MYGSKTRFFTYGPHGNSWSGFLFCFVLFCVFVFCLYLFVSIFFFLEIENKIYIYIYIRGAYDNFPDFFRMGTFIDSTRMKL